MLNYTRNEVVDIMILGECHDNYRAAARLFLWSCLHQPDTSGSYLDRPDSSRSCFYWPNQNEALKSILLRSRRGHRVYHFDD